MSSESENVGQVVTLVLSILGTWSFFVQVVPALYQRFRGFWQSRIQKNKRRQVDILRRSILHFAKLTSPYYMILFLGRILVSSLFFMVTFLLMQMTTLFSYEAGFIASLPFGVFALFVIAFALKDIDSLSKPVERLKDLELKADKLSDVPDSEIEEALGSLRQALQQNLGINVEKHRFLE